MKFKLRFLISPYFIIRFYLLKDIRYYVEKYKFEGSVIDVGCGQKPFQYLFSNTQKYTGIDFKGYSINKDFQSGKPDIFFKRNYIKTFKLPFKDNTFDNAVSFQVLEHHKDPDMMVKEITRVIKRKGLIMITAPFLVGLHEGPNDFQRYTEFGLRELFKKNNCEVLDIKGQGSVFSTIYMAVNENFNYFAAKSKFNYFISLIIYPLYLVYQYVSLLLDPLIKTNSTIINYIVIAEKK